MVSVPRAAVGVSDHCGWAVLVTIARDGAFLDRRRVEIVDADLPKLPHHHECESLPIAEALALVERVRRSAEARAAECLEKLAAEVPATIERLALRACPRLPPTVEERLASYWAQNRADSVMYRHALVRAAEGRGWSVHWYEAKTVATEAARALGRETIEDLLATTRAALGPPWQKDHQIAMAAAIASSGEGR